MRGVELAHALQVYLEVRGDVDVRTRLAIAQQAEALLVRGRWTEDQVVDAGRVFATLPVDPRRFALWAHRGRLQATELARYEDVVVETDRAANSFLVGR